MDCSLHLLLISFCSTWYFVPLSKGAVSLYQNNSFEHSLCTSDKHVRLTVENVLAGTSGSETMVGPFDIGPALNKKVPEIITPFLWQK